MFESFKVVELIEFNEINTSNIMYMGNMFYTRSNLIALDVSNWDISKVTNISYMFYVNKTKNSEELS